MIYGAKYIFTGEELLSNKLIKVENQQIVEIMAGGSKACDIFFEDEVIGPGMIDLQINGAGGVNFNNQIKLETLEVIHQTNLKHGVTHFLPTFITAPTAELLQALEVVKKWVEHYGFKRGVLGIHLEGPFISADKPGIHPQKFIIQPSEELLNQIVSYAKLFTIMMTIAPEVFSPRQIAYLKTNGVIISLGHTNASFAAADEAFKLGASSVTHLFNAMSGFTGRSPGVLLASLINNCSAGLIVDLLHVAKESIQYAIKTKPEQIYLVTDAVAPSGTNLTEFEFAGKKLWVKEGKCVDDNGTLGGANLTLDLALKNLITHCEVDLITALKAVTLVPAKVLKQNNQVGRIKKGIDANLIRINLNNYQVNLLSDVTELCQ